MAVTRQMKIPSFKETLENAQITDPKDQSKIIGALEKLLSRHPYKADTTAWLSAVEKLVQSFFSREISATYRRLTPSFLDMQWEFKAQVRDTLYDFTLPLFAESELPGLSKWNKQCYGNPVTNSARVQTLEVEICASPPVFPKEAWQAFSEAQAVLYDVFAKALRTPQVQRVLLGSRDGSLPVKISNPATESKFIVVWRPKPEQLDIIAPPERDPAILLKYQDSLYVVHVWETDNELPVKQILAEYAGYVSED